jgi:hypothetical protein
MPDRLIVVGCIYPMMMSSAMPAAGFAIVNNCEGDRSNSTCCDSLLQPTRWGDRTASAAGIAQFIAVAITACKNFHSRVIRRF